jgi:hypothetical protein
MLHPYWAPLRHLVRLVDRAFEEGARDVLVVGSGVADGIADHLPGVHARLSLAEVLGKDLDQVFDSRPEFDLCICTLTVPEASAVPAIMRAVTPYMPVGARIIIFIPNLELNHDLRSNNANLWLSLDDLPSSARLYFAGGARSAMILQRLHDVRSCNYVKRLLTFFLVAPQAIVANMEEAGATEGEQSCPASCTSIIIEISIGSKQPEDEVPIARLASAAENALQ